MEKVLDDLCSDGEIEEAWKAGCDELIPKKSKQRYELAYASLCIWLKEHDVDINEKNILAYFVLRNSKLTSPGSLWSEFSMLKTMIKLNNGIDIGSFNKLLCFLKKKNVGHRPKKSKVFSREDVNKFLNNAPDDKYLLMKVVMIMGIAGACRREELVKIMIDDVEDRNEFILVNIPNTKTNISRSFTITEKAGEVDYAGIFRKYIAVRPENCQCKRFFLTFRNGKCIGLPVGINSIGAVPSKIAMYLDLEDPKSYTGHAFRRTSATFFVDSGADLLSLKRHGGWKSSSVAEGYVENSLRTKMKYADQILYNGNGSEGILAETVGQTSSGEIYESKSLDLKSMSGDGGIAFNNCTNCNITINISK